MTFQTTLSTALLAAACALATPAAQAGRPLQTEDAGLLERGNKASLVTLAFKFAF